MKSASDTCILLVDDNEFLLRCLGKHLASLGFRVLTALRADEALALLRDHTPDLIVLELVMPGMGGMAFLKRILGEDGKPQYPVLVLTVRTSAEEFCCDLGVEAFLSKTCSWEELTDTILDILAKAPELVAAPEPEEPVSSPRVLLAEDEERISRNVVHILEEHDYDVEVVSTGPQVLEQVKRAPPDLILMKQVLPGMNGSAVARELSRRPALAKVPVVLYDETRAFEGRRRGGVQVPEGVKMFLPTAEAALLFDAVCEVVKS